MDIVYSPRFIKLYKRLPGRIRELAVCKEKIFVKNTFDARLKTHGLQGELIGRWSFSVNYQYRIVFVFETKDIVNFLSIGTHEVYKE